MWVNKSLSGIFTSSEVDKTLSISYVVISSAISVSIKDTRQ